MNGVEEDEEVDENVKQGYWDDEPAFINKDGEKVVENVIREIKSKYCRIFN